MNECNVETETQRNIFFTQDYIVVKSQGPVASIQGLSQVTKPVFTTFPAQGLPSHTLSAPHPHTSQKSFGDFCFLPLSPVGCLRPHAISLGFMGESEGGHGGGTVPTM